jgi:DNA-binding response OmpR family regulator
MDRVGGYVSVKRILIVAGERETRDLLARTLVKRGFWTVTACDGVSGLFQFGLIQPDLVILDAKDWETLQRIRDLSGVPIIVLIEDEHKEKVESLDRGADFFVIKPPDVIELDAKVRALFRRGAAALAAGAAPGPCPGGSPGDCRCP